MSNQDEKIQLLDTTTGIKTWRLSKQVFTHLTSAVTWLNNNPKAGPGEAMIVPVSGKFHVVQYF